MDLKKLKKVIKLTKEIDKIEKTREELNNMLIEEIEKRLKIEEVKKIIVDKEGSINGSLEGKVGKYKVDINFNNNIISYKIGDAELVGFETKGLKEILKMIKEELKNEEELYIDKESLKVVDEVKKLASLYEELKGDREEELKI